MSAAIPPRTKLTPDFLLTGRFIADDERLCQEGSLQNLPRRILVAARCQGAIRAVVEAEWRQANHNGFLKTVRV
jgi:hypothetical protein